MSDAGATAGSLLPGAIAQLRAAGVDDPARDARVLLAHALGVPGDRVSLHLSDPLAGGMAARFQTLINRRAARQPVSQIIGRRLFWGRPFLVTADVLDPRPETETLIAAALEQRFSRVLDLGTGSGAILVTLLADCPAATGLGVDLSEPAIAVARANAQAQGVAGRAGFAVSDWFDAVDGAFDLIVANPPYISADEFRTLAPETRNWEPPLALTPGGDGLDAYRAIAAGLGGHLCPGGRLLVEIGPSQGAAVVALLRAAGLTDVRVMPDLDGRDRVVTGMARQKG
ncbi:MAG: peptide chain release factor N(5)-glutamine methyltransferase [Pararhodobacter sp.]